MQEYMEIVERHLVGEEGPDAALVYREHAGELMRFATGLVGRDAAEDVFSQAIVKALAAPKWPLLTNPRAYLYRAVFNEANTWRRRAGVRRSIEGHLAGAVRWHEDIEPRPEVAAAVANLSLRQRAVIVLTYWSDLDPASIGERLGISDGSVRRHLARARARLREVLDE
jgi:RNA polymerase sigma-70 factor (ECF subfamily)